MSATSFDASQIESRGWRQGSVLSANLAAQAADHAPKRITVSIDDWIILTSHDCDIVNRSLQKEPFVEVIRSSRLPEETPDRNCIFGKSPREIQLEANLAAHSIHLQCLAHDRWFIPREWLLRESPCPEKQLRPKVLENLIHWMAKRYLRAALPNQFDARWRNQKKNNLKSWFALLGKYNASISAVYIRLSTMKEIEDSTIPYRCSFMIAVPKEVDQQLRDQIEDSVRGFWKSFSPQIEVDFVEVLGLDKITLDEVSQYKRFDADWLSFSDDDAPLTGVASELALT